VKSGCWFSATSASLCTARCLIRFFLFFFFIAISARRLSSLLMMNGLERNGMGGFFFSGGSDLIRKRVKKGRSVGLMKCYIPKLSLSPFDRWQNAYFFAQTNQPTNPPSTCSSSQRNTHTLSCDSRSCVFSCHTNGNIPFPSTPRTCIRSLIAFGDVLGMRRACNM
jgi:hypothetical protein